MNRQPHPSPGPCRAAREGHGPWSRRTIYGVGVVGSGTRVVGKLTLGTRRDGGRTSCIHLVASNNGPDGRGIEKGTGMGTETMAKEMTS